MIKYLLAVSALLVVDLSGQNALAADAAQMEQNKKAAIAFEDAALNQKDFDEAAKYLGSRYTQHNPTAPANAVGSASPTLLVRRGHRLCQSAGTRCLVQGRRDHRGVVRQNMVLLFWAVSGTGCITSQCSTTLPFSSL
jgi:hypothetical protein